MTVDLRHRSGQSLAEVLVATAVTAILIMAAIVLISPILKSNRNIGTARVVSGLNSELTDNLRSVAESNWHNLTALSTSSAYQYHVSTSTSPFIVVPGKEVVAIGSSTYTRYFYLEEVRRDLTSGAMTTSTTNSVIDPAVFRVNVVIEAPSAAPGAPLATSYIIARTQSKITIQSDWSGGAGYAGPTSETTNQFASSSNINATATP